MPAVVFCLDCVQRGSYAGLRSRLSQRLRMDVELVR
eukprot:COSAG06_NODE_48950_length_328_cov_1.397380_1_plen_35_part_01